MNEKHETRLGLSQAGSVDCQITPPWQGTGWLLEEYATEGAGPRGLVRFAGVPTAAGESIVGVEIGVNDRGRLTLFGVSTEVPFTQAVYLSLPLAELAEVAAHVVRLHRAGGDVRRIAKRDRGKPESLAYVAELSRQSLTRTEAAEVVARALGCASLTTAKTWIEKASEAGFPTVGAA